MKKWLVKNIDKRLSGQLAIETKLPSLICDLLVSRGIYSAEQANEYFNGSTLSDPLEITDMEKAAHIIDEAIQNDEKITVYGDYDCDGVTATVMLYSHLDALGADVDWYIPTREEGYGLNADAVRKIAEGGTSLIITVDNGVSAENEAELIYELGMRLVITDHHQPPDTLPRAEAIVNPHRADDLSQYKQLAGCGVVLKLIMAMENDIEGVLEQYADIAAIGTIGDVVALTGENRVIVRRGLSEMQYTENQGVLALISAAGLDEEDMTSTGVAFGLCPRINAAGRYGSPRAAAELFLSQTKKLAEIKAEELCELNDKRKQTENDILEKAKQQLESNPRAFGSRVLVVYGEGWNHGIIGIVSARLLDLYAKPCIVIGIENGEARGSARSVEGFSVYNALDACSDLLTRFGGHTKAGGFSLDADKVEEFIDRIQSYAAEKYPVMPEPTAEADLEPEQADLNITSIENLKYLQPFGEQNPVPLFLMRNCRITSSRPLKNGKYTAFSADYKGTVLKFLCFSLSYDCFTYNIGDRVDVLANLEINDYNNTKSISVRVKEIRHSGFEQDKYFAAKRIYEKILLGERVDGRLAARIIPSPQNMKLPFDLARSCKSIEAAAQIAMANGVNYCLFMMCLHVFAEFGHIKLDRVNKAMEFIAGGKRIDTASSAVIRRIKKSCGLV